jgi:Mg-chelatase subunit ChlD
VCDFPHFEVENVVDNTKTDITFVLDRSGSMNVIKAETIGGFNRLLADQRKLGQDVRVTVYQFDDQHETLYTARPVAEAPDLTPQTFVPRGFTALKDAIGMAIVKTGERLAAVEPDQRPGKVLFVIMTDGGENASHEYQTKDIARMIKHQTDTYGWDFTFIGANQDSYLTAGSFNINSSLSYGANAAGTVAAFASTSNLIAYKVLAADAAQAMGLTYSTADHAVQKAAGAVWGGVQ